MLAEQPVKSGLRSYGGLHSMMNVYMVVNNLRPQLEVTKDDIEPVIIMGLYHHRDLIGSPNAFLKVSQIP